MKKIITALMISLLALTLAGCGGGSGKIEIVTKAPGEKETSAPIEAEGGTTAETGEAETGQTQEETAAAVINDKPVNLFYMNYDEKKCEKVSSYAAVWNDSDDLAVFGAFNTDESFAFTNEIEAHQKYWDMVDTAYEYKIGYEISFEAGGQKKLFTIKSPKDIRNAPELFDGDVENDEVTGYLGVWMYDDYHQDGSFYSHITPEEYGDDTLLTSIKLRLTPKYDEVSNLKLTAFSYSSDLEFDADGHYNGAYGCEVSITKK